MAQVVDEAELRVLAAAGEPTLTRVYRGWEQDLAEIRRNHEARVLAPLGYLLWRQSWEPNRWVREGWQREFVGRSMDDLFRATWWLTRQADRSGNAWLDDPDMSTREELFGTLTVTYRRIGADPPPVAGEAIALCSACGRILVKGEDPCARCGARTAGSDAGDRRSLRRLTQRVLATSLIALPLLAVPALLVATAPYSIPDDPGSDFPEPDPGTWLFVTVLVFVVAVVGLLVQRHRVWRKAWNEPTLLERIPPEAAVAGAAVVAAGIALAVMALGYARVYDFWTRAPW